MIIFMGVAGSGKSVQGRMLADALALPWLSTGEFLRMLVSGKKRKDMLAGKLLTDEDIIGLVQRIFSIINPKDQFVLDGFPRTPAQADWLISQARHDQVSSAVVVHLLASEETVKARLNKRGRQDDNPQAIAERFKEYELAAKPILDHFKQANIPVIDINGAETVAEVHRNIREKVEKIL